MYMKKFFLENFFDLKNFVHQDLWEENKVVWHPLTILAKYLSKLKLGIIETTIPSSVYLINPELISIGKGTVVEPGVYIKGPCVIGKNCSIRHSAYLRGNVISGDNCVIGHTTEVKNSIFLNGVHSAHFAYIGDSIIGNNVNLGAGVKCANYRLDKGEIAVFDDKKKIYTGLKKFGAIISDNSQIGCNSVLNPGTIIGKDAICYPSLNIGGVIPDNSVVRERPNLIIEEKRPLRK